MESFFSFFGSAKAGICVPGMPSETRAKMSLGSLLARKVQGLARSRGQVRSPASPLRRLMASPLPSCPWHSEHRSSWGNSSLPRGSAPRPGRGGAAYAVADRAVGIVVAGRGLLEPAGLDLVLAGGEVARRGIEALGHRPQPVAFGAVTGGAAFGVDRLALFRVARLRHSRTRDNKTKK